MTNTRDQTPYTTSPDLTNLHDEWSQFWPDAENQPFAHFINNVEKYVATSTPLSDGWHHAEAIEGPIEDVVRDLKARPGSDIGVHGSITLRSPRRLTTRPPRKTRTTCGTGRCATSTRMPSTLATSRSLGRSWPTASRPLRPPFQEIVVHDDSGETWDPTDPDSSCLPPADED